MSPKHLGYIIILCGLCQPIETFFNLIQTCFLMVHVLFHTVVSYFFYHKLGWVELTKYKLWTKKEFKFLCKIEIYNILIKHGLTKNILFVCFGWVLHHATFQLYSYRKPLGAPPPPTALFQA
jgi:hypothetical protein